MVETLHTRINVSDRTYQAIARSEIKKMSKAAGFKGHRLGELEIVVAEITSNLWKHAAKGGYILVRTLPGTPAAIEIIAIDEGPGMSLPGKVMNDGHSTTNTLGHGLGAIKRLSNVFDLYSLPGWGTILFCRVYTDKTYEEPKERFRVDAISVAMKGQKLSGDSWKCIRQRDKIRLAVIDGLGHGPSASNAALEAVEAFLKLPKSSPSDQIRSLHINLKKTRGAVINVVNIDMVNQQLVYSGVGNIGMKIITPLQTRGCFSYNGIVGHILPAVIGDHSQSWTYNDTFIMHTDGISARWDLQKYPKIGLQHQMLTCAALYKDFNRGNDDATILIGKFYAAGANEQ